MSIYFKFFPKNLILQEFQYKIGLNVDTIPFEPTPECTPGGLYYTDINHLENFKIYGEMIGIIKIPEGTPIVKVEEDKYKSPQLELVEVMKYDDFVENKDLYIEEKMKCTDPKTLLRLVKEQTPEICLAAVTQNGLYLQYVKEQTPEICLAAIKRKPYAINYVKDQSPDFCLAAVKENRLVLKYIEKQTPEICLAAVKQDGLSLEYVRKQTPEICLAAVNNFPYSYSYVLEKTHEIYTSFLNNIKKQNT